MIGTLIAGRFRLERKAGAGGMGTVYCAQDILDGTRVGVKLVTSDEIQNRERFVQEAAILADLRHPGIVRYVAHGVAAEHHFMVMEWLEGDDLAARIERGPLGVAETLQVVRRAAEALAYAHRRGVIHRDIKPQNLFLPGGQIERLKVLDFGIARLINANHRLTRTGMLVGTPGYLAPELAAGAQLIEGRADIFSLGCVAFFCLTGRPVWRGDDPGILLAKILVEDAPYLSDLVPEASPAVADLVARMLEKDPGLRPTAVELLEALTTLKDDAESSDKARRRRQSSLTVLEQRVSCVVVAGAQAGPSFQTPPVGTLVLPPDPLGSGRREESAGAPGAMTRDPTLVGRPDLPMLGRSLRPTPSMLKAELSKRFGAKVHPLPKGRFALTLPLTVRPVEQAALAARCALALRESLPGVSVVVAAGVGQSVDGCETNPLVTAAMDLLDSTTRGQVRLDHTAADLIDPRFELQHDGGDVFLRRERDCFDTKRNLLGRPTSFVGRGREMSVLADMLTDTVSEATARVALVTGPAGIGKSRLLHELVDWVHQGPQSVAILFAAADSVSAGAPLALLGRAIRRQAEIEDGAPLGERRAKLAACVARRVTPDLQLQVTAFLGEIAGVPFPDDEHPALRIARQSPPRMADETRKAWTAWLGAECAAQPVLIVLEDLHWGDPATVGFIDHSLRALADQPLMVLALARPDIQSVFPNVWAERRVRALQLGPLSRKASDKLIREALGPAATGTIIEELYARATGNPFYLEELVRAAHDGRIDCLPASVLGAVQARLDAEGPEAKRILRAASVFGERFPETGILALVAGQSEPAYVAESLHRLVEREILCRAPTSRPGAEPELAFGHALVREAAYATLTDDDRTLGHRLAGEWLEETERGEPMMLAEHFRRGGVPGRAAPWYRCAAEQALKGNDLGGAIARAERGLEALAAAERSASLKRHAGNANAAATDRHLAESPEDTRGALLLAQAEAYLWRGDLVRAEQASAEAMAIFAAGTASWFRAAGQAAVALGKKGKLDGLQRLVQELLEVPPARDARDALVTCLGWAGSYLMIAGQHAIANTLLDQVTGLAHRSATAAPQVLALAHRAEAVRASMTGDLGSCLDHLNAALGAFDRSKDARNACGVRSTMGYFFAEVGEIQRADELLREALADAERLGLLELVAIIRHQLGRVLAWGGHRKEAERLARLAISDFQAQGRRDLEGMGCVYLASTLEADGRLAQADTEASRAVGLFATGQAGKAVALAVLARVRLAQGRTAEALVASQEAHDSLEALGTIEEGESMIRLTHAQCLSAAGRSSQAQAILTRARNRLLARAECITEIAWREDFVRNVPENAHTLALAEALLQEPIVIPWLRS